ncbi:MAG: Hsp20/alpha crystallin family protein [Candidatus Hydrogenedentes bacterium]|nr:Hsp20/alpha crystallin family protein [Candidatus Hydrogenedentota bacterium]
MRDLNDMLNRMQGIMRDLEGAAHLDQIGSSTWQPLADIFEREDSVVIVVELPGVHKSDIRVSVTDGVLRIEGTRNKRLPENTQHVHLMEIPYGQFARYVRLPECAATERIEADFADGYLTIQVFRKSHHE